MNTSTRTTFENLHSDNRELQTAAFFSILDITNHPVDWAYEVWDDLVHSLSHPDNHQRAIAAQVLCNLAKSDPENRMLQDFERLLAVTKDERFVTARHCLQSLWKVGVVGKPQQQMVVDGLARRFNECSTEKNGTLIRADIIENLRKLYRAVQAEAIEELALALIETEADAKYRKKYARIWNAR